MPVERTAAHAPPDSMPCEAPHPDTPLEWWFVQGWFEGRHTPRRHFLSVLFKIQETLPDGADTTGHLLLTSHLDPATRRHQYRSEICPAVIDIFLSKLEYQQRHNLDADIIAILADELRRYGPPHPIRLESAPVHHTIDRLDCSWGDTRIRQTENRIHLLYRSPEDEAICSLHCEPVSHRFFVSADKARDFKMNYACTPRLTLAGSVAGQAVHGEAWFDHQWGDHGLLNSGADKKRVLGWEWFGINLDDGTDIMLYVSRDMQDNTTTLQQAFVSDGINGPRLLTDFAAHATRTWESGTTRCRYPLDWELHLPMQALHLTLTPLADDQEIPLFGTMRTVWEGACRVTGFRGRQPVAGRARLELHGYGYIHRFQTYLDRWIEHIDDLIKAFLPPVLDHDSCARFVDRPEPGEPELHTTMLAEPVWDMFSRGGKRWRPIFGFLLLEALGRSHKPFEQLLAATFELNHLGSLIIDDIEDDSLLRRKRPSIHLQYGLDLAINAGNTLYMLPLLLLENHPALTVVQREQIYQVIIRHYVKAHFGQAMDIHWSKFMSRDRLEHWLSDGLAHKVLRMYAAKTGASVVGVAQTACIITNTQGEARRKLMAFAEAFGVAFQILDDVLNFSPSHTWTKTVGEDLAAGKPTYVIIQALEQVRGDAGTHLRRLMWDADLRSDAAALDRGIEIVQHSGVLEQCREEARAMVRGNWEAVADILRPSEAKTMLRLLCANLTDLTFVS
ncbi:polyprenyl synthetase family protein [Desulfatitalea alkaliphila]|uniref:Polyprenyl synthetase family protein n=1 Tax=Desulfatitalea alkaliphila TaxID=2929485 RepID=A0AA41R724_9BACT|nr:polyprenyl synthetase family protein [Desulfatitalea alkaliphila]MCJ8500228.1 polyprenyl synthetase family protein [Desulfatitalea alkaliphila]